MNNFLKNLQGYSCVRNIIEVLKKEEAIMFFYHILHVIILTMDLKYFQRGSLSLSLWNGKKGCEIKIVCLVSVF